MITGVDKTRTGSYDTFYDNQDNTDYAYLGIRQLATPVSSFTFPSASRNNYALRDLQMYTPYPTGTERGKLYLVDIDEYKSTNGIPGFGGYTTLHLPNASEGYFIVTPTLNDPSYNATQNIAIYSFESVDELWDNGYRITGGTSNTYNPVTTKAIWDVTKNSSRWTNVGYSPNDPDPLQKRRSREQIIQNMLTCTSLAYQIQSVDNNLDDDEILHGALLVAGRGSQWDNTTWKGIVPISGSLVQG